MIKRLIFKQLVEELTQPEVTILLGPRQVGKTTLLLKLYEHVKKKGLSATFFDLEQPAVLAGFNLSSQDLVEKITSAGQVVFIDEFHYLENASKLFKAVYDSKKKVKIICSGSSSLEIHKHLKESLAGRRVIYRIFPLQYSEMVVSQPKIKLEDYLVYGGMPGLQHGQNSTRQQQLLQELLGSYVLKDVKALLREENIRAFNHLLYLLAENQGSMVSVHSLANQVHLSSKAIGRYLDILESTYVNYRIHSYSRNLGNELKKSFKTYLYDLGMRHALLKDFSGLNVRQDKGVLYESFVCLHLLAGLAPNMELKFWRTRDGAEVDFILLHNRRPLPIEVKAHWPRPEVPRGLKRFLERYPEVTTAWVVNETLQEKIQYKNCDIIFMSFSHFAKYWKEKL